MNTRSFDVRVLRAAAALYPLLAGCGAPTDRSGSGARPDSSGAMGVAAADTDDPTTSGSAQPQDEDATEGDGSSGEPVDETTGPVDSITFGADVWPMFRARCSCHDGFPAGGLALEPGTSHVSLIDARAQGADMVYVVPGDLDNSYLWIKLKGEQESVGGDGVMMPQAGIPLVDEELELVERWILSGALP